MGKEETIKSVKESSEIFEVQPWLSKRIEDYSQGMRQRLILAAALMHKPKLIVIDEPMVGLDPKGAETFKAQIKLVAQRGSAVFLTTHQLSLAKDICSRIGIICASKLSRGRRRWVSYPSIRIWLQDLRRFPPGTHYLKRKNALMRATWRSLQRCLPSKMRR